MPTQEEYAKLTPEQKQKNIESSKKWKNDNVDNIKEYSHNYRIENADKIKQAKKVIITCFCGAEIQKNNIKRHQANGCKKPNTIS